MQTRHTLLPLFALVALLALVLVQGQAQEDPPLGDDFVRCRQCDEKGKMACRTCEGKGKLYKTCPQCDGGGRRPCRQCNKPNAEEPNEAGPGRINCGYCGGDGKFGSREKRCPKCGGEGAYPCPSCRGKGSHKCKTELPAGICPSCRFTGKTTCNTCYGKLWVRRQPDPVKPKTKTPENSKEGEVVTASKKFDHEALLKDAQGRFDSLTAIQTREKEIDTGELRRSCEKALMASKGFLLRLERIKDKPGNEKARALYDEIRNTQKQMRSLKSDLFDLDTLLLEFEKAYRRCEARMESRPKSPFNTTKKKKELAAWSENIAFSLKAAEKLADSLGEGEVFLAGKTSGKIEEDLNLFDSRIQSEEALASAPAKVVKPPADDPEEETGTPATDPEEGEEKAPPSTEEPESSSEGAKEKPEPEPAAKASPESGEASSGPLLLGILCGLGGALVGAGILLVYLRKNHYF